MQPAIRLREPSRDFIRPHHPDQFRHCRLESVAQAPLREVELKERQQEFGAARQGDDAPIDDPVREQGDRLPHLGAQSLGYFGWRGNAAAGGEVSREASLPWRARQYGPCSA